MLVKGIPVIYTAQLILLWKHSFAVLVSMIDIKRKYIFIFPDEIQI